VQNPTIFFFFFTFVSNLLFLFSFCMSKWVNFPIFLWLITCSSGPIVFATGNSTNSTEACDRRCLANSLVEKELFSPPQDDNCTIVVNITSIIYQMLSFVSVMFVVLLISFFEKHKYTCITNIIHVCHNSVPPFLRIQRPWKWPAVSR